MSELPDACEHLWNVRSWRTGPHALTAVRNDLVHPEEKLGDLPHEIYHEAWNLGQWYIEMMLLNKLSYKGEYANRLLTWRDGDQAIQFVPWTQGQ